MKNMEQMKEVKIFSAEDYIQAEMIIETLKNNQIPALKKEVGAGGIMNLYTGNSMCGEDIFVASDDVQKAKEILLEIGLE